MSARRFYTWIRPRRFLNEGFYVAATSEQMKSDEFRQYMSTWNDEVNAAYCRVKYSDLDNEFQIIKFEDIEK